MSEQTFLRIAGNLHSTYFQNVGLNAIESAETVGCLAPQILISLVLGSFTVEGSLTKVDQTLVRRLDLHHLVCVALNGLVYRNIPGHMKPFTECRYWP